MDDKFEISEKYLDDVLKRASQSLVGEVMKRHEILKNSDDVKKETKELIYEKFRELKALIKAFNSGVIFTCTPKTKK